jgi:hypothetical protein
VLIVIDKYIFKVKHNISEITKTTSINYDKQKTITKPIYTHLGGFEEEINFEATILLNNVLEFLGFESLVKKGDPLNISSFDLIDNKQIFITKLIQSVSNFVKTELGGITYYTKKLQISGFIIE